MVPGEEVGAVSPSLNKSITEHDSCLATSVAAWLRKRGKALRPRLNDEQKAQLEECFELMDADGSGAIDADELGAAFKLLGIEANKSEITQLLAEVDSDGSGEVEYPEFIQIMTSTLAKLSEKKEQEGSASNQVPFALLATAYRRKRLMEGLTSGDKEMTTQVIQIAEEAARKAADEAAHHQQEGLKRVNSHRPAVRSACGTPNGSNSGHSSIFKDEKGQHGAAGASPSLLRALDKVRSLKVSSGHSSSGSSNGNSGDGSATGLIQELLGEQETAKHLAEMLKQHAAKKQQQQQLAAGSLQQANHSSVAGSTSPKQLSGDGSVHFSPHRTSVLQQKQLTQQIEVPKFVLHKGPASGNTTPKQQSSRSASRAQARPGSISPLQSGFQGLQQQLSHDMLPPLSPGSPSQLSGGGREFRARRSKSFNGLDACLPDTPPGLAQAQSANLGLQLQRVGSGLAGTSSNRIVQNRGGGVMSAANYAAVGAKH